jgi:hypothetical protein
MFKSIYFVFLMAVMIFNSNVFSDIAVTSEARKNLQLTVYKDFGVIKDSRLINLPQGTNKIRFEGVATGILSSSVFLEWPSATQIQLISQSYEFDLVSPHKLMEKYIGKELDLIPRREIWKDSIPKSVELVGINGDAPVFRVGTRITFGDIGQIMFPYMPDNLYTKPTLIWDIQSLKRQESELSATYMSEGLSWKPGYVLQLDLKNGVGLFSGWITIDNQSGMDFKDAQVSVVSGKVPRFNVQQPSVTPSISDQDYFLYSINTPLTIEDQQEKQIEWIPQVTVYIKQTFMVEFDSEKGKNSSLANVKIEIENNENNGLGMPLPEGVMRVFKKDNKENRWFIGENLLNSTPTKQAFSTVVNGVGEISGEKAKISKEDSKDDVFEIALVNKKDSAVTIIVKDLLGNSKLLSSSDHYRVNENTIEWIIKVPAKNTYRLQYHLQKKL